MSEVKVNKISPRSGTTVTLGDSGDTFTIPSGATITNSGTAAGFGSTGEISWDTTKKTSTFTAVSGVGYFCDTSGGAITVNLPAGTAGNSFAVADYTNTFQTNNLTISPNGSQKIGGTAEDAVLSTEGQSAYFVYVDDTEGWKNVIDSTSNIVGAPPYIVATGGTITTSGNCKIHTFTGPGTFTVCTAAANAADNIVSHVVVAGGGGGAQSRGGGGGAGGFREVVSPSSPYTGSPLNGYPNSPNRVTVTATAFPITVGGGGAGGTDAGPSSDGIGTSGSNSVFSTITSAGGGGGAPGDANNPPYGPVPVQRTGLAGGSGGGGGSGNDGGGCGGAGNTPPVSPAQGFVGGNACGSSVKSAGGGGATAAGAFGPPGGCGGAGATSSINATPTARAGGGGGGQGGGPSSGRAGGAGGGGPGGGTGNGDAGTVNTGGGGGGGGNPSGRDGGAGGSGIVIIRYRFQ
ncbi:putative structural protein [phage 023Pt_psg01]|nr:putative structural protein [phage 023Pt_psg01]